jgi:two-component system sensor histidine kinase/response regulator
MKELVILCVDDEEIVLKSLKRELNHTLRSNKYIIETANGGENALELFEELSEEGYEIPVVICDHIMPGIKGDELLQRIHGLSPKTLNIMLTGQADMEAVTNAVNNANLYRYIAKPWEKTDLALTVREAIRRYLLDKRLEKQHKTLQNVKKVLEVKVKERTAQLEAQKLELKKLNTSKDKFFSIIARDLRTPFSGLHDIADSIVKNIGHFNQDEIKRHVASLRDSAETVSTLIENLLEWSQLQQGMMVYHPEALVLSELVEQNKLLFASHATRKRITLVNEVLQKMIAYADRQMIDTVIRNLISNALKFTYPGGIVFIATRQSGDYIDLTVSDTGAGIPQEDIPGLFRIDVKYSHAGTAGEEGTGLGLVLCKGLVERNGGKILVESEAGQGTVVTIRLLATRR